MRQPYISLLQILFFAIIASLVMTSCEDALVKDLDLEGDFDFEQRLGLSGTIVHQFDGDQDFQISGILLAESQSIVNDPEEVVYYEGGELNLFRGSNLVGQFQELGSGRYVGIDPNTSLGYVMPPDNYTMEVEHPTLGMVSATTTMPEPVYLTEVTADSIDVPISEYSDLTPYLITLTFRDPPGKNFYGLQVETKTQESDDFRIESYVSSVNNPNLIWLDSDLIVFSDEVFDDSEYTVSFYVELYNSYGGSLSSFTFEQIKSQLRIVWSCLSEDRYRFDVSHQNYILSTDLGPFSEPVTLYSNVENGLGYFGASNYYIAKFD